MHRILLAEATERVMVDDPIIHKLAHIHNFAVHII